MCIDICSEANLVERVSRSLDIAESAVSLLLDREPTIDVTRFEASPDKLVAETAMLARSVASLQSPLAKRVKERATALAVSLIPHARSPRVAFAIALHPALATDYAAAHHTLSRMGFPDEAFDALLARANVAATAWARERVPHRELEQAWLAHYGNDDYSDGELLSRTALGRGVDIVSGSRDDFYALTHALMYATDFGRQTPALPRSHGAILNEAQSALAATLDDDDFDLSGELLLTWPFLQEAWGEVPRFAFRVLTQVEDNVGLLPSFTLDGADYAAQPDDAKHQYLVAAAYHTAFVMGLLCASCLHRLDRRSPPSRLAGDMTVVEDVLGLITDGGHSPAWVNTTAMLTASEKSKLVSFYVDVALRRALRTRDVSQAALLLEWVSRYSLPVSPVCSQVAATLLRLGETSDALSRAGRL